MAKSHGPGMRAKRFNTDRIYSGGFPRWCSGREIPANAWDCMRGKRHGFDTWVREKRRKWQPTPVFLSG